MEDKLLKPYDPQNTEERIYQLWEESGFFQPEAGAPWAHTPETNPNFGKTFTIMLPPPNATGTLHIGGALMTVIEDIMVRYKRMRGFKTLWLPGTDHAAIATNSKVEKILQKEEGKSRHDIGREAFVKKVEKFVEENRGALKYQINKMGASLDWSREAFTLDEKRNLAVVTAFKKMFDAGLIYRGTRIINWDPKGQTTISDDEIVYEERDAKLYTFKYSNEFPIPISTTRPETKIGDTAVAAHPSDPRYKKFVGKTYHIKNFAGAELEIKVVADESVEKDFGTGALGVTPAHSQIDAEIAKRHNLPSIQVINEYAKISLPIPGLEGEKVTVAREKIADWLKKENLLIKEENIKQNVSTAERTGGIIEPLPKLQWFVDVNKQIKERGNKSLKTLMLESVSSGQIKILPERFEKTYFQWINNLRDWNISRQIWYGHRIPVWYHKPICIPKPGKENQLNKCLETVISAEKPICEYCDAEYIQDEDTLDTWFSSGLWTFSTLGWPNETKDLKIYHPTDVLETGYDILFFWVARMILMSQFLLGEIPFKTVYLHGLVRNEKGQKISKSLGGNIDPLEITSKYGTDAVRMSLIVGVGPGADSKLGDDKLKAYKNFANKIWNATRFVLDNTKNFTVPENPTYDEEDKKSNEELKYLVKEITKEMDEYKFYIVAEKLYHYFWHTFADVIIERSKKKIAENKNADSAKALLFTHLITLLKALHPFMPFVTEEIWSMMPAHSSGGPGRKNLLLVERWPFDTARRDL